MEDRLRELTKFDGEDRGAQWAKQAKAQGQKVIGIVCAYMPEELIYAAGMFPTHVFGTRQATTPLASLYRPERSCGYCTHVLESFLAGDLDYLDGIILSDYDDDRRRLGDVWEYFGKPALVETLHVPYSQTELACRRFALELTRVADVLRGFGGRTTAQSLRHWTAVCNKTRQLLQRLYELRRKTVPPLTGAEYLGIVLNSMVMPKEIFNAKLEALLPYLEQRQPVKHNSHPRIMVSSDLLDNPSYLEVIESAGCVVAMDDFDTGIRYAWKNVDESARDSIYALAKAYLRQPADARSGDWDRQMDQIIQWVKDFDIDGVVELRQVWSRAREMRMPYFLKRLTEASIPVISIEREYSVLNVGQMRNRVEAFLEMVGERKA